LNYARKELSLNADETSFVRILLCPRQDYARKKAKSYPDRLGQLLEIYNKDKNLLQKPPVIQQKSKG